MNDESPTRPRRHATAALVGRLIRENVRHCAGWLALALVAMVAVAGSTALSAWLMEPVVNQVFIARRMDMLWLVGGGVLATFAVKGLANYAQSTLMAYVGLRIIADNQARLFAHLMRLDLQFFHDHASGGLIARFMVDINQMRAAVSNALTGFGKDLLSVIGLVAVMFIQDWRLALVSGLVFPLAVLPIARLGQRMRKVTANTQSEAGLLTTLLGQAFQGIRIVKAYGMEGYESERTGRLVERIFRLSLKSARVRALASPIMETLGGLSVALVIVYGGYQVIAESVDAGSFFSFITALLLAYEPMKRLANLNTNLQEGLAGAARLFDLLDRRSAIEDRPGARVLERIWGDVRLEAVRFAYPGGGAVLEDVTLEARAGQTVALVGPSGAGKSTILNLIPRFFDVEAGRVTVDGTDVREVAMASLFRAVALVSQEVTLFDDTVRANIAYGRIGASEAEIVAAAEAAAAHEFILGLPQGYDTPVGEHGVKLSGGQRQRLAIARAMLKNAPILLLDEATSALDTESERQVQAAIEALKRGRTTLVIAHRLSTVTGADRIYVIDRGRVAEEGAHADLLARGGAYARLHALQFRDSASVDA